MRITSRLALFAVLLLGLACTDPTSTEPMSAEARAYLTEALDLMEANSIHRYRIDWPVLREDAFSAAEGAQVPRDTYEAIRGAIRSLGDRHSWFFPPDHPYVTGNVPEPIPPTGDLLGGDMGYVQMPPFSHPQKAKADQHAEAYHRLIEDLDAARPCGWIVDLRANAGGNMYPMLTGIGPILGEGTVGYFIDADGERMEWYYEDGAAGIRPFPGPYPASSPYRLHDPDPPVAVLTGPRTGSSGEAVAIAFRGRPDARSFGEGTAGVSTGISGFPLSDGAILGITTVTMADRTGKPYGEVVPPDEPVHGFPARLEEDPVVIAAGSWLRNHAACLGGVMVAGEARSPGEPFPSPVKAADEEGES